MLCFSTLCTGHGKGLFIAPAVTDVLRSCPLTAFIWSGCTCRPHCATQTFARQRRTCFVPLCVVTFPATMLIPSLPTLRACTQRFPLKLPLLGGLFCLFCGLSFGLSLHSGVGSRMIMGFTFLWPTFGFLHCLPR